MFDHYTMLEATGVVPYDAKSEGRLVAVSGRSTVRKGKRDDYRLKGWVGATEKTFGPGWDKGHFIAHAIGGAVDQAEVNVFVQRRDLNRGWSAEGRRYRDMERYCELNPGRLRSRLVRVRKNDPGLSNQPASHGTLGSAPRRTS